MEISESMSTRRTGGRFRRPPIGPQAGDWVRWACGGCGAHRYAAMRVNGPSGQCSVCGYHALVPLTVAARDGAPVP